MTTRFDITRECRKPMFGNTELNKKFKIIFTNTLCILKIKHKSDMILTDTCALSLTSNAYKYANQKYLFILPKA